METLQAAYLHYRELAEKHYLSRQWAESRAASLIAALFHAELVEYKRPFSR